MPEKPWDLLLARMADLRALQGAIAILSWDQETYLPRKGAPARGEQLAALQGLHHEKLTAPELGDALLDGYEEGMRVARLEPLFDRLAGWLAPMVARLVAAPRSHDPFAGRRFDAEAQWRFSIELLEAMGFDLEAKYAELYPP